MIRYKNLQGNSGVRSYEYGENFIRVEFLSGEIYLYTYESAGWSNIEQMKVLAKLGKGLNTFINYAVQNLYYRRER